MTFNFGTVSQNLTEARESPLLWIPGVNDDISFQIDGSGTIGASPTMLLYENGADKSSTLLTGALSVSGRVIKTKTLQNLVGGNDYRVYVYFTDDGIGQVRELTLLCPKLGVSPSKFPMARNRLRLAESPVLIYPSQSFAGQVVVEGYGTIGASPTMSVYKGTSDDSANVLSGVMAVAGRTITLKTISGLSGGSEYTGYVFFTDGGKSTARYFDIICPRLGV